MAPTLLILDTDSPREPVKTTDIV